MSSFLWSVTSKHSWNDRVYMILITIMTMIMIIIITMIMIMIMTIIIKIN